MQPPPSPSKRLSKWVKIMTIVAACIGIPAFLASISEDFRRYMGHKFNTLLHGVAYVVRAAVEPAPKDPPAPPIRVVIVPAPGGKPLHGKTGGRYRGSKSLVAREKVESSTITPIISPAVVTHDSSNASRPISSHVVSEDEVLRMRAKAVKARGDLIYPLEEVFERASHEGDILFNKGEKQYALEDYKKAYDAYKGAHIRYCSALYKTEE